MNTDIVIALAVCVAVVGVVLIPNLWLWTARTIITAILLDALGLD
jgi:hypothetical protein